MTRLDSTQYYQLPAYPDLPDNLPDTCSNCDEPLINWGYELIEIEDEVDTGGRIRYLSWQELIWATDCSSCGTLHVHKP